MDSDDLEPPKKKAEQIDMEVMSIEALGEYIEELEAEIERARAAIALKNQAKNGAESFFK